MYATHPHTIDLTKKTIKFKLVIPIANYETYNEQEQIEIFEEIAFEERELNREKYLLEKVLSLEHEMSYVHQRAMNLNSSCHTTKGCDCYEEPAIAKEESYQEMVYLITEMRERVEQTEDRL